MGLSLAHREGNRLAKPPPPPEDVFLAWLMSRRENEDLRAAADDEIRTLNRYDGPHPGPRQLRSIFEEFREKLSARK